MCSSAVIAAVTLLFAGVSSAKVDHTVYVQPEQIHLSLGGWFSLVPS